jgi:hypothetical protein
MSGPGRDRTEGIVAPSWEPPQNGGHLRLPPWGEERVARRPARFNFLARQMTCEASWRTAAWPALRWSDTFSGRIRTHRPTSDMVGTRVQERSESRTRRVNADGRPLARPYWASGLILGVGRRARTCSRPPLRAGLSAAHGGARHGVINSHASPFAGGVARFAIGRLWQPLAFTWPSGTPLAHCTADCLRASVRHTAVGSDRAERLDYECSVGPGTSRRPRQRGIAFSSHAEAGCVTFPLGLTFIAGVRPIDRYSNGLCKVCRPRPGRGLHGLMVTAASSEFGLNEFTQSVASSRLNRRPAERARRESRADGNWVGTAAV